MKQLSLPASLQVVHCPDQTVVKLWLTTAAVSDWCLGLCLLREHLTDGIVLTLTKGKGKLELLLDASLRPQDRMIGRLGGGRSISVTLNCNTLDYLTLFALKCYRDGYAAVDHIDLEVQFADLPGKGGAFTVHFEDSAPPLSSEELKRLFAN